MMTNKYGWIGLAIALLLNVLFFLIFGNVGGGYDAGMGGS